MSLETYKPAEVEIAPSSVGDGDNGEPATPTNSLSEVPEVPSSLGEGVDDDIVVVSPREDLVDVLGLGGGTIEGEVHTNNRSEKLRAKLDKLDKLKALTESLIHEQGPPETEHMDKPNMPYADYGGQSKRNEQRAMLQYQLERVDREIAKVEKKIARAENADGGLFRKIGQRIVGVFKSAPKA